MNNNDLFFLIRWKDEKEFFSAVKKEDISQVDDFGSTLLHSAIASNKLKTAEYLIDHGIDINYVNRDGHTALHFIGEYKSINIAKEILEHGGRLDIADKYGNEPLWTATFNAKDGNYDLVELYLEYGADPFHKNTSDRSPYSIVEQRNDEEIMKKMRDAAPKAASIRKKHYTRIFGEQLDLFDTDSTDQV